jgi:hypothetical protein
LIKIGNYLHEDYDWNILLIKWINQL